MSAAPGCKSPSGGIGIDLECRFVEKPCPTLGRQPVLPSLRRRRIARAGSDGVNGGHESLILEDFQARLQRCAGDRAGLGQLGVELRRVAKEGKDEGVLVERQRLRRRRQGSQVRIAKHDGLDRAIGDPAAHRGMDFLKMVGKGRQGRVVTPGRVIAIVEYLLADTRTDVLLAYRHPETDSARRFMKCRFIGQDLGFREMREVIVPEEARVRLNEARHTIEEQQAASGAETKVAAIVVHWPCDQATGSKIRAFRTTRSCRMPHTPRSTSPERHLMSMTISQAIDRLNQIPNDLDIRGRLEAFELCAPNHKGRPGDISMVKSALWQGQLRIDADTLKVIHAIAVESAKSQEALTLAGAGA